MMRVIEALRRLLLLETRVALGDVKLTIEVPTWTERCDVESAVRNSVSNFMYSQPMHLAQKIMGVTIEVKSVEEQHDPVYLSGRPYPWVQSGASKRLADRRSHEAERARHRGHFTAPLRTPCG